MKLREFLLARIAEDEAAASTWYEDWGGNMESLTERVLAECEAKRRIVELHYSWELHSNRIPLLEAQVVTATTILRVLASVHSDHPDFEPKWKLR